MINLVPAKEVTLKMQTFRKTMINIYYIKVIVFFYESFRARFRRYKLKLAILKIIICYPTTLFKKRVRINIFSV